MRRSRLVFVVACLLALGLPSLAADGAGPADSSSKNVPMASQDEVQQLRSEVAAQKQTIEELKTMVGDLAQRLGSGQSQGFTAGSAQPGMATATLGQAGQSMTSSQQAENPEKIPEKKKKEPGKLEWTVGDTTIQMYGHADVSYDYVDNGITPAMEATNPFVATVPSIPVRSNNGWLGQLSSNLSYFGVRGTKKINSYLTGVFQFESEVMMSDTPGPTSDLQCKHCLGSRDTYVGLQGPWGAIKAGKEDAPYKRTTTGAFDPFLNSIADARSIMGNSGGDNRAEFMGRISHAIWYESPTYKGLYASVLFAPGQQRSTDNSGYPRGEPNCAGGNGAFTLSFINKGETAEAADFNGLVTAANGGVPDLSPCNDGSFGNVLSAAATYRGYGLYLLAGYEHHAAVNRFTDLVGVADEAAWKLGAEYTIKATGTTPSFVYERLKRYAANGTSAALGEPTVFPALNERSRYGTWLAVRQKLTKKDTFSVDWLHAGRTPGDPGQCAGVDPTTGACNAFMTLAGVPTTEVGARGAANNQTNMYGIGLKHAFTNHMTWYFVASRQANHGDAHFDLGAVGHGIVVDKKDWTGVGFTGTRIQGVSSGVTFDF